jgi:hypothetical protein
MDVMGDFRKLLVSWVAAIMAIVLAAKTAWELFTLAMSPRDSLQDYLWAAFYWFVLFVATSFIAIFLREWELISIKNKRPVIGVDDFGIHIKEWVNLPPTATVFVKFKNEPYSGALDANAKDVYPEIIWKNENGIEIERNSGRWQIPNRNKPGRENLKTTDLMANGESKLFHFAVSKAQTMIIEALWRNDDDQTIMKPIGVSDTYEVIIVLTDSRNIKTKFLFRISLYKTNNPPNKALRLEKISKRGKIESAKEFNFNDLNISNVSKST